MLNCFLSFPIETLDSGRVFSYIATGQPVLINFIAIPYQRKGLNK